MEYFSSASSSSNEKPTKKPAKRGVKLSTDPQSVAARERRHRISERFKILQSLVPGGTKMDTVSMLEEAINYVKFLKSQILLHQSIMDIDDSFDYVPPHTFPDYLSRVQDTPAIYYDQGSSESSKF